MLKLHWKSMLFGIMTLGFGETLAFSPETHVWIGQEVLKDVLDDGFLEVDGNKYAVDAKILRALKESPGAYLAGHIGPDTFPDPIAGQMTTHPGLEEKGGWSADQFLKMILHRAARSNDPKALSFAYGYIGHAAGDIFAHTYVNRYAGDVFSLSDEALVEDRHFTLEKYIGQHTPYFADNPNQYDIPAEFVRDALIFNKEIYSQYGKADFTGHLQRIYELRILVSRLNSEAKRVNSRLDHLVKEYAKLHTEALGPLGKAQLAVSSAKEAVGLAKNGAQAASNELARARKSLDDAEQAILENDKWISILYPQQSEEYRKAISLAESIGKDINREIANINAQISDKNAELSRTVKHETANVCNSVRRRIKWLRWLVDVVCTPVEVVTHVWNETNNQINRLNSELSDLQRRLGDATASAAANGLKLDSLIQEKINREARRTLLKAAVDVAQAYLRTQEELAKSSIDVLSEAERGLLKAENALVKVEDAIKSIIDDTNIVKSILDKYNPITAHLSRWEKDIDAAMTNYVKVGLTVGINTVRREGNILSLYTDWWKCWSPVFLSVPAAIPQAGCALVDAYHKTMDDLFNQLGDAAWILLPTLKISREAEKKIRSEIDAQLPLIAQTAVTTLLGDKDLGRLVARMVQPGNISESSLTEPFVKQSNTLNKNLIIIPDVVERVKGDLNLRSDGKFDPQKFLVGRNAVLLTKMSLLNSRQLNQLFANATDYKGTVSNALYPENYTEPYSLLLDSVRSLDGNHQWQEWALPYPRQEDIRANWDTSAHRYGYSAVNSGKGFLFWENKDARPVFFGKIFKGPLTPGLDSHEYLQDDKYPFPECDRNPFPNASIAGVIIRSDYLCARNIVKIRQSFADFVQPVRNVEMRQNGEKISTSISVRPSPLNYIAVLITVLLLIGSINLYMKKRISLKIVGAGVALGMAMAIIGQWSSLLANLGIITSILALAFYILSAIQKKNFSLR